LMIQCREMARILGCREADTEHLLLALLQIDSLARSLLAEFRLDARRVRKLLVQDQPKNYTLETHLQRGSAMIDKTPYTPGMREALKLSKAEAGRVGSDYIGPEHYLLGIIRKGDGLALQALINLGLDVDELKEVLERAVLGKGPTFGLFSPNNEAKWA